MIEIYSEPAVFVKVEITKTISSEVYLRVPALFGWRQLTQGVLERAAKDLAYDDWSEDLEPEYQAEAWDEVDENEAHRYGFFDVSEMRVDVPGQCLLFDISAL